MPGNLTRTEVGLLLLTEIVALTLQQSQTREHEIQKLTAIANRLEAENNKEAALIVLAETSSNTSSTAKRLFKARDVQPRSWFSPGPVQSVQER